MIDRMAYLAGIGIFGKPRKTETTVVRQLTLVVQTGNHQPRAVKQYPIDKVNSAIRVAVGIVKQNRSTLCVVFDDKKKRLAKIQSVGLFGGKINVTRYYGDAKTKEVLKRKDIEALDKESYV